MMPLLMWCNGFSFTIDVRRHGGVAVVLVGAAGAAVASGVAESAAWSAALPAEAIAWHVVPLVALVSLLRIVAVEWPRSPLFVQRVVATGRRHWVLTMSDGCTDACELRAAWVAGPVAGLVFQVPAGGRRAVILRRHGMRAADWRRLRVRMRHP